MRSASRVKQTAADARLGAQLRRRGFRPQWLPEGGFRVRCDSCAALVLNGVACHEQGCPADTSRSRFEDEDDDDE